MGPRRVTRKFFLETDMTRFNVRKVAVLGAGVMGAQIAAIWSI